jgi:hypothetical protein
MLIVSLNHSGLPARSPSDPEEYFWAIKFLGSLCTDFGEMGEGRKEIVILVPR